MSRFSSRFKNIPTDLLLGVLLVVTLSILILLPMATVVLQPFFPEWFGGTHTERPSLLEIFRRPLWYVSLKNSLFLAVGTGLIGGLLGAGLALLRHSVSFPGRRFIDPCVWLILILPSFVVAQGWILFASPSGIVAQIFGAPIVTDIILNPVGLVAIMSLKNFPLAYIAMSAGLQWSMHNMTYAGRLCGASATRSFLTIRLPLLMPAVLSGIILVFIDTIGDFGLPAALATSYRFPTLPYTIYAAINHSPIRFDLAGILAIYLAGIMFFAMLAYFWILRSKPYAFLSSQARNQTVPRASKPWLVSAVVGLFFTAALIIPIGTSLMVSFMDQFWNGLFLSNFNISNYIVLFSDRSVFIDAYGNSLRIAGAAAILSAILAFISAYLLTFTNYSFNKYIDSICTLSMAIPGVILGVGFIFVWNSPLANTLGIALYGETFLLVLASTATSVPVAVRILMGAMAQVPVGHLHAAMLQGAGLTRRLYTIVMPLSLTALISACLSGFGSSVFELAINTMLRPPRFEMLAPYVSSTFQSGEYGLSTAAVFVSGLGTAAIIMLCHKALAYHFKAILNTSTQPDKA